MTDEIAWNFCANLHLFICLSLGISFTEGNIFIKDYSKDWHWTIFCFRSECCPFKCESPNVINWVLLRRKDGFNSISHRYVLAVIFFPVNLLTYGSTRLMCTAPLTNAIRIDRCYNYFPFKQNGKYRVIPFIMASPVSITLIENHPVIDHAYPRL